MDEHIQNIEQELQSLIESRAEYYSSKHENEGEPAVDAFEETYNIIADGLLFLSRAYIGIRRLEDAVREILSEGKNYAPQDTE